MPTRRQTIIGLTSAATGGAVVSAGAFTSSVSAGADMRIVVVSELRLEPARDDNAYVTTEGGLVESIEIEHLNRHAFTDFGEIVRIVNEGNVSVDRFVFEFSELDEADEPAAEVMGIVSEAAVEESNGTFTLTPEDGLAPGGSVAFGITVDLLPDGDPELSDFPESSADLGLEIVAERDE